MAMTSTHERSKPGLPAANARSQEGLDFDSIFQEYWNRVCAVIYRLVGDPDETQDLALETFLRLHQNPPEDPSNIAGWLYRVATRLGLNSLRSNARRQRYESEASVLNEPVSVERLLEASQERQQVLAVLKQMKPQAAELVLLRSAGLSYAEIAAAMDIRPSSVGTLLARAEREFEKHYLRD